MNKRFIPILLIFSACATEVLLKKLTIAEQHKVDAESSEGLTQEFKKESVFISLPKAESFLSDMAEKILNKKEGFEAESVEVLIHDDSKKKFQRFFSFPGATLSIPISFLRKVEFENELAAAIAFEIANLLERFLVKKVETKQNSLEKLELFGSDSVFGLSDQNYKILIKRATALLYDSGFDTRGVASIFRQYPNYYLREKAIDSNQNQVDFYLTEAKRAKSDFMPQMSPIVKSEEFIQFKKELLKKHP